MTFEQIFEGSKWVGHVDLWGKSTAEAIAGTKSLRECSEEQGCQCFWVRGKVVGDEGRNVVVGLR